VVGLTPSSQTVGYLLMNLAGIMDLLLEKWIFSRKNGFAAEKWM